MERWSRIGLILVFGGFVARCCADPDLVFYDSFDEPFEERWTVSDKDEYTGVWKHSKSEGHDDYGLLVSQKAMKYGIVRELDEPVSLNEGRTVVLQYEVRFQNGLECGGAYLKFLQPQDSGWTPKEFNSASPYSIMFGPDKCGIHTNKVHFIFRHRNPKTGSYAEHHLTDPPIVPSLDNFTHVYTAIFKPGNKVLILIDGEEKRKASLLEAGDFDPPLVPPETIPDPNDFKPEEWDERDMIPDPDASKRDDWDETAPMEIDDEEAVKPEGWLDDEPEEIDDPDAAMPEDWDEEEDGEWEAPRIENPRCELAPGCGEWTRPTKMNPDYKGKWEAPLVKNPSYRGIWKPREIPNPDHFELEKLELEPISAVGIEIWTMQEGILFDNILVSKKESVASFYRDSLWLPKFEVEKQKAEEAAPSSLSALQTKMFELLYKIGDIPLLKTQNPKIRKFLEKAEKQPNMTTGVLVSALVLLSSILFKIFLGIKKPASVKGVSEKSYAASAAPAGERESSYESEEGDAPAAPRRRTGKRVN